MMFINLTFANSKISNTYSRLIQNSRNKGFKMSSDNVHVRAVQLYDLERRYDDQDDDINLGPFDRQTRDRFAESKRKLDDEAVAVAIKWLKNEHSFRKSESMLKKARLGKNSTLARLISEFEIRSTHALSRLMTRIIREGMETVRKQQMGSSHAPIVESSHNKHQETVTQDTVIDLNVYHRQALQHRADSERKREDQVQAVAKKWLKDSVWYDKYDLLSRGGGNDNLVLAELISEHRPASFRRLTKIMRIYARTPLYVQY
jgi:hypothetical protein